MAVTSLWYIKGNENVVVGRVIDYADNPNKTVHVIEEHENKDPQTLTVGRVISYAKDVAKTELASELSEIDTVLHPDEADMDAEAESVQFVTPINIMDIDNAANEMQAVKEMFGKTTKKPKIKRVAYHGYQSFAAGEVSAELAHEIGVKLATELWGDKYQVIVATHLNTEHFHNHFVINNVSFTDGKMFYLSKADYRKMREVSDRLCKEAGLCVVDTKKSKAQNYGEWYRQKTGDSTIRDFIRADLDRVLPTAYSASSFMNGMKNLGYTLNIFKQNGDLLERPGLSPPGSKKNFRFYKLGEGYTFEEISERINRNAELRKTENRERYIEEQNKKYPVRYVRRFDKPVIIKPYFNIYSIMNAFERVAKRAQLSDYYVKYVPVRQRKAINEINKYEQALNFISENRIKSTSDIKAYIEGIEHQKINLYKKRAAFRKKLSRISVDNKSDEANRKREEIAESLNAIESELQKLRIDEKRAQDVMDKVRESFYGTCEYARIKAIEKAEKRKAQKQYDFLQATSSQVGTKSNNDEQQKGETL